LTKRKSIHGLSTGIGGGAAEKHTLNRGTPAAKEQENKDTPIIPKEQELSFKKFNQAFSTPCSFKKPDEVGRTGSEPLGKSGLVLSAKLSDNKKLHKADNDSETMSKKSE